MGFAGADDNSYDNLVSETNAVELPLSICYRCSTSHIKLVKKEFPYIPIEPAQNANIGIIKQIEPDQIYKYIKNEDVEYSFWMTWRNNKHDFSLIYDIYRK